MFSRHVESSTIWPIHQWKPDPTKPGLKRPLPSSIRRILYTLVHQDDYHNTDPTSYPDVLNDNH